MWGGGGFKFWKPFSTFHNVWQISPLGHLIWEIWGKSTRYRTDYPMESNITMPPPPFSDTSPVHGSPVGVLLYEEGRWSLNWSSWPLGGPCTYINLTLAYILDKASELVKQTFDWRSASVLCMRCVYNLENFKMQVSNVQFTNNHGSLWNWVDYDWSHILTQITMMTCPNLSSVWQTKYNYAVVIQVTGHFSSRH